MAQPPSQLPAYFPSGVPCVVCRRFDHLHQQGAASQYLPHGDAAGGAAVREQPIDQDVEGAPAASVQAAARAGAHGHVEATLALQGDVSRHAHHGDFRLPLWPVAQHRFPASRRRGLAQCGILQWELVLPHAAVVQLRPHGLQHPTRGEHPCIASIETLNILF